MSSDSIISVRGLSKCFQMYSIPSDRLKETLANIFPRLIGRSVLKKYHKEFWALRDINIEIKRGETFGVIGRNGSGKSTFLQMLCGTLQQTEGSIFVNGRIAALLELGSGFNTEFTGRENVYLNGSVLGLSKKQIDERFSSIEKFAEIGDFIDQPVKTYSSGMFVRLAFAVIVHVDATILVIDEALAVGDAYFTQKCMRFLRKFRETGTLILVSHDAGAITGLCDKALWLDKGIAQEIGPAKEVCEAYLASLYQSEVNSKNKKNPIKQNLNYLDNKNCLDPRVEEINRTHLRNDIEVFKFSDNGSQFGSLKAIIKKVELTDGKKTMRYVVGGDVVHVIVKIFANEDFENPIVGFSLKDKLGQILFGDNTYLTYVGINNNISAGQNFTARFSFRMPILPAGEYVFSAAVANGTQEHHEQLHWIQDALVIRSLSSSVSTGLLGIPMQEISIEKNVF